MFLLEKFKSTLSANNDMIDIVISDKKSLMEFGRKLGYSDVVYYKELNIAFNDARAFENKRIDVVVSLERASGNDFIHYKNSGMNQVLCKLAKKNGIAIGFNFNDILIGKPFIGRMMQNVRLCRKYKVNMILASFASNIYEMRNPRDLISFGRCIGMTDKEAKDAVSTNIEEIMSKKQNKGKIEGIRKL